MSQRDAGLASSAEGSGGVTARPHRDVTRGRLRIYLGGAPGVGKTFAMLGEGHRLLEDGTEVVVGFVETHDRRHTADMLNGLEVVPRRLSDYRGGQFEEMDLDAILARGPQVALVDELAHTNVPGSRNTKRWEDINDLLDAGIDVISTVNIQHLESLNDVTASITGIQQRETVPDAFVRSADQLHLVDMSPEALRHRLAEGNVYKPEKVDAALGNYFRTGNLTALRELALLWLADRVEEGLEKYRADHNIHDTWAARTRIVVALSGGPEGEKLLRRGALISGRSAGRALDAVHVIRGDGTIGAHPGELARLRQLTEDLGGNFHTVVGEGVAAAVLDFARSVNGTQVVVGVARRSRLSTSVRPSTADDIVRESGDIDVHVVSHQSPRRSREHGGRKQFGFRQIWPWVLALAIPVTLTLVLLPFSDALSLPTVLLTFLLGVVGMSLVVGLVPAIASALVAGVLVNFYFVPPLRTFLIAELDNVFALIVFVIVASVVATIVNRSSRLAHEAARRGAEANVLASLSAGVLSRGNGVKALLEQACETFGMHSAALFETSDTGRISSVIDVAGDRPPRSIDEADVTADAGHGLVMALSGSTLRAADRRMLEAFAAQTAAVLERDRLSAGAAEATRLRDSDAIRTSLIAEVSHDLSTPLATVRASIAALRDSTSERTQEESTALLDRASEAADRLDSLLADLLDLSRIHSGALQAVLGPVCLDDVLRQALTQVPETSVRVESDRSSPQVLTDAGLLERAIAVLVAHAVRHSPPGIPVHVSTAVVPGGRIQLRIVDQRPGGHEVRVDRVHTVSADLPEVPDVSDDDLGLAVARGLSEGLGATLEAEKTPGGGLTMVMTIPMVNPEAFSDDSSQGVLRPSRDMTQHR